MEFLLDPTLWVGLLTLVVLEVILGIDNLVFIAILADKLPPQQRDKARVIGLSLALVMRLILLSIMSWMIKLTEPLVTIGSISLSGRDLILITGGIFLIYKATMELHEKLEGHTEGEAKSRVYAGFWAVVAQIIILDAVFSLDAVITAVGMVDNIYIMMAAVIIAMTIMVLASKPLTRFVNAHSTVVILCLSFLLMIGFSLLTEGFGLHLPKGYLYAAIGFSILIEALNQWRIRNISKYEAMRPRRERTADAILKLMGGKEVRAQDEGETEEKPAETFNEDERYMVSGVLTLSERSIKTIMTPRSDISWINLNDDPEHIRQQLLETPHSLFPVCRDYLDRVVGVLRAKDIIDALDHQIDWAMLLKDKRPLFVSENLPVIKLINILRHSKGGMAIVTNEFGSIQGLVTPLDIFEAIAGEFPDEDETPDMVKENEHTWLVKGSADLYQLELTMGTNHLMGDEGYITVAGLLMNELEGVPEVGAIVTRDSVRFTVLELQGHRITLVRVELIEDSPEELA
ncbi:TerC family protein [Thiofilum flexile]|uniref:TerC family protein n=1 Tax=Thiofilum flexile TaxID=125627 RepID=UPI0003797B50|nr:TerC family protein [Thiofilum flexile]